MNSEEKISDIHVLVVAPPVTSWGLKHLLESGSECVKRVDQVPCAASSVQAVRLHAPDLVVLDLDGDDDLGAIKFLHDLSDAPVLVLLSSRSSDDADGAVLAGARGVVNKHEAPTSVVRAAEKVCSGELWLDREATARVVMQFAKVQAMQGVGASAVSPKLNRLTRREKHALETLLAYPSLTIKVVADRLFISEQTLRKHLTSIYAKLDVRSRAELHSVCGNWQAAATGAPPL